jgi:putative Holliday junction resolvase
MRVLGVDYGRRRIGLALSDPSGLLARPWKSIGGHAKVDRVADALAAEVGQLRAEDDGLEAVVLGWPRRLGGEASEHTSTVEALATALRARVPVTVVLQDERLSSREAEQLLASTVRDWRKRKPLLDAAAAAVILQDYLDGLRRQEGENTLS